MYTMYEALARERMRESREQAHQRRAVFQLSVVRRAERLERRAHAARLQAAAAQRRQALDTV